MSDEPIICDLSAIPAGERKHHVALARKLFMTSSSSIEIADGIQMTIAPERLDDAASFIANERRCCRHLTFSLHVPPRDAPLLLRITGPGAAEELRALLR